MMLVGTPIPDFLVTQVKWNQIQVIRYHNGVPTRVLVRRPMPRGPADTLGISANVVLTISPDYRSFSLAEGVSTSNGARYRLHSYRIDGKPLGKPVEKQVDFSQAVLGGWIDNRTPAIVSFQIGTPTSNLIWSITTARRSWETSTSKLPLSFRRLTEVVPHPQGISEQVGQSPRWRSLVPRIRNSQNPLSLNYRLGFSSMNGNWTGWLTENQMIYRTGNGLKTIDRPTQMIDWYCATPVPPKSMLVREWRGEMMAEYKSVNTIPQDPYVQSRIFLVSAQDGHVVFVCDGFGAVPIFSKFRRR